jgi:hypothetical protein
VNLHGESLLRVQAATSNLPIEKLRDIDEMAERTERQTNHIASQAQQMLDNIRSLQEVQATHSAQLLPVVARQPQIEEFMSRSIKTEKDLQNSDDRLAMLNERLLDFKETQATHGTQLLRMMENETLTQAWPEMREDVRGLKDIYSAHANDVSTLKMEVADLREMCTRQWREIAGLHQDTAQFASMARHSQWQGAGSGKQRPDGPMSPGTGGNMRRGDASRSGFETPSGGMPPGATPRQR